MFDGFLLSDIRILLLRLLVAAQLVRKSSILWTLGIPLVSNGQRIFVDFEQLADGRMILGRLWLSVILEPIIVRPLEVFELYPAVVFMTEQLQDGEDERLMALLGQVELDQLEDRMKLVAFRLGQQLSDCS